MRAALLEEAQRADDATHSKVMGIAMKRLEIEVRLRQEAAKSDEELILAMGPIAEVFVDIRAL